MKSNDRQGAHIVIQDTVAPATGPLLPQHVNINGVDVGYIAVDGIQISPGDASTPTSVTITFLPRKVEIKGLR